MTHTTSLTPADRCDRDQAERASVALAKTSHYHGQMELQLCSHHYNEHSQELADSGWTVTVDLGSAVPEMV